MKQYNNYQLTEDQLTHISNIKKRLFVAKHIRKNGVLPTDEEIEAETSVTENDLKAYKPILYTNEIYKEDFIVAPGSLEPIDDSGEEIPTENNTGETIVTGNTQEEITNTFDVANWRVTRVGTNTVGAKLVNGLGLVFNSFANDETAYKKIQIKIGTQDRQHMKAYWTDVDGYYTPELTTESAAGTDIAYITVTKNTAKTASNMMLLGQLSGATGINSNNIRWETMPVYVDKPYSLLIGGNASYNIAYNQLTSITLSIVSGFEVSAYCSTNAFTVSTNTQGSMSRLVITNKTINETGAPIVGTIKIWVKSPTTNTWLDTNKTITITQRQNTATTGTVNVMVSGATSYTYYGSIFSTTASPYTEIASDFSSNVSESVVIPGPFTATTGPTGSWSRGGGVAITSQPKMTVRRNGTIVVNNLAASEWNADSASWYGAPITPFVINPGDVFTVTIN